MRVIKLSIDKILEPLTEIINLSLESGCFPDALKIAKVLPIFKSGDPERFENYRPISILPAFSKLFEKVVYNRIYRFLTDYNLLHNNQFGFRRNHSTPMALIQLANNNASSMDNKETTVGVFLDLSKAFDTIDHHILLDKLDRYAIRGPALEWIKGYLTNRKQFVQFGAVCSQPKPITCGVPHGSILGPLLFIIYINDLPNASKVVKTFLFADDTSLFYSHKDRNQTIAVMNYELMKIMDWLKANKLSLNIGKTNYILFHPKQKFITFNNNITLDNVSVKQVEVTKFLGVFVDQHLSWKSHISYVAKKISKTIGIISKSRFYLSRKSLLSLYYTLVYPYLNYCNIVLSSNYPCNLNRLLLQQKRIVRIIGGVDYFAHTGPLFYNLNILDIFNINAFLVACFMYSYHNHFLPNTFDNLFSTHQQIHTYNTRNAANYCSHYCRTNIKQFTILHQRPKVWNSLPRNLTLSNSYPSFKTSLKKFLLDSTLN